MFFKQRKNNLTADFLPGIPAEGVEPLPLYLVTKVSILSALLILFCIVKLLFFLRAFDAF